MSTKEILTANRLKTIIIENSTLKICDRFDEKKEFPIKRINKIFLKGKKPNFHTAIMISIISGILFTVPFFLYEIEIATFLFVVSLFLVSKLVFKRKNYNLFIKFSEDKIYAIKFQTDKKEEILSVIWEIRKRQFLNN
jgi:hypothetical protein